jgi:NADPH:quinone reductase-like Zn-dependent oxidoreductase/acyl carrier protein
VLVPAAAFLEMARSAVATYLEWERFALRDVAFVEPLALTPDKAVTVQVTVVQDSGSEASFRIASRWGSSRSGGWTLHVSGRVDAEPEPEAAVSSDAMRDRFPPLGSPDAFYAAFAAAGVEHGPAFHAIRSMSVRDAEGFALLRANVDVPRAYGIHPTVLDAGFQVGAAAGAAARQGRTVVPSSVRSFEVRRPVRGEVTCHASARSDGGECDVTVFDGTGQAVVIVRGLCLRPIAGGQETTADRAFLLESWQDVPARSLASGLPPGPWVIVGDDVPLVSAVVSGLADAGCDAIGVDAARVGTGADAAAVLGRCGHVVLLAIAPDDAGTGVPERTVRQCTTTLGLVQALARCERRDPPRLWLVTRGAVPDPDGSVAAIAGAGVWGLGRVIALEHPELRCVRVDVQTWTVASFVQVLVTELGRNDEEEEVRCGPAYRQAARIAPGQPPRRSAPRQVPPSLPVYLAMDRLGSLDDLDLREGVRTAPGEGEVEIAVRAAGLNFRDVLTALGSIPYEGEPPNEGFGFGAECAGHIVRVGPGVEGWVEGDEVVALGHGLFASFVKVPVARVFRAPPGVSAPDAATLPVAFVTAWYALRHVARLGRGERVLIHAGAGGVGLAAIQCAQHLGAEIFATAGSDAKRELLRSLGVAFVSDSRSRAFADDIRRWTKGEGVDVVLNSLTGDLSAMSLDLLRHDGRFVELGIKDAYAHGQLGLRPFVRNLTYALVNLRSLLDKAPLRLRPVFDEVLELVGTGALRPLRARTVAIDHAPEAFRHMAQGAHTGKIVLTFGDEVRAGVRMQRSVTIRPDASYLVTGGLGALGLSAAEWLVETGAREVMLIGRRGVVTEAQQAAIERMQAANARVTVVEADVAEAADVDRALDRLVLPLRGVVHAAGVIDDGLLVDQREERFAAVMRPKVYGAWILHERTRHLALDFFVLYSSAASLLGTPSQGNYVAASAFLDALAHLRRAQGLAALTVNWGPFRDVGLAAVSDLRGARLEGRGLRALTTEEGIAALVALLSSDAIVAGPAPMDIRQWVQFHPQLAGSSRLRRWAADDASADTSRRGTRERLVLAHPEARTSMVEQIVRQELARVLRLDERHVDHHAPLSSLGLDSLTGLELRNRVEWQIGCRLSPAILWRHPTVAKLARYLVTIVADAPAPPPEPAPAPATEEDVLAAFDASLARAEEATGLS